MEKRIGSILIKAGKGANTNKINSVLSEFSSIIISRQGIPNKDRGFSLISVIFEATTDEAGALSGKLGRIKGVFVRSLLLKDEENDNGI